SAGWVARASASAPPRCGIRLAPVCTGHRRPAPSRIAPDGPGAVLDQLRARSECLPTTLLGSALLHGPRVLLYRRALLSCLPSAVCAGARGSAQARRMGRARRLGFYAGLRNFLEL